MKDSSFAYYTVLAIAASFMILMFSSLTKEPLLGPEVSDPYKISCQHPAGHIVKYKVSRRKDARQLLVGGKWFFKTTTGKQIVSTFCHLEVE